MNSFVRWFGSGLVIGFFALSMLYLGAGLERSGVMPEKAVDSASSRNIVLASNPQKDAIHDALNLQRKNAITNAVEKASPAVVGIAVTQVYVTREPIDPWAYYFGFPSRKMQREHKVESLGSGYIMTEDGYIVTNEHVVHGASEIVVTMTSSDTFHAKLVGTDYDSDLALLKIGGTGFPYIKLTEDENIVGEWVIAMGNPWGLFSNNNQPSVTVGVVSALDRDFQRDDNGRMYSDMIQTDASINSGNSGGPLLNVLGEVIGVNAFIFTKSGGSIGIGFAIPAKKVHEVIDELKERETKGTNVWTGIAIQDISLSRLYGPRYYGQHAVFIVEIDQNSPGAKAGLEPGDIILEVGGIKMETTRKVREYFNNRDLRVGDKVPMKLIRDGKKFDVAMVLEERPK